MNYLLLLCLTLILSPRHVMRVIDGSGDVLPRSTSQNRDHSRFGDPELRSDPPRAQLPLHFSDSENISCGNLCSTRSLTSCLSLFALTIDKIVNVGPDEQVSNIHAGWVVTRVKHLHPSWYRVTCEEPCSAVRFFDPTIQPKMPVAFSVARTQPKQTTVGVRGSNLCAESLGKWEPPPDVTRLGLSENGFTIPPVVSMGFGDQFFAVPLIVSGVGHKTKDRQFSLASPADSTLCWSLILAPGEVLKTVDGDTFYLRTVKVWPGIAAVDEKVRVLEIDTPERGQPGFDAARAFTANWLAQGDFTMTACKRDSFGRLLVRVTRDGASLADALYAAGHGTRP